MLEQSKRRHGHRMLGLWVSIGMISAFAGMTANNAQAPTQASPAPVIQAGPIDDTLDYIECLINRLLNVPCDGDEDLPSAPPIKPIPEGG